MRPRLLIPALLASALAGQGAFQGDAAETRIASVKADQDPAVPAFGWLRPKDHHFPGAWELNPDYSRVVVARELIGADFEEGEQQAWAARLGWGPGPHWLLLSPSGEPLLSGTDPPDPAKVLDAMRGTGWRPRFELRDQFLREHPDNGDARDEALYEAARFASHRAVVEHRLSSPDPRKDPGLNPEDIDKRPTPPEQDQAQWGPAASALSGLMSVEGWAARQDLLVDLVALRVGGVKNSTLMREPLRRLRLGIEDALRQHPENPDLWIDWQYLWDIAPDSDPRALLQGLDAMPREPWPPLASSVALVPSFVGRRDWIGLETVASQAYAQGMSPSVRRYQGKDFPVALILNWGFPRLLALEKQGRGSEARGFVKELRTAAGSSWPEYASTGLAPSLEFYLGKDDPLVQSLQAAKEEKAPPDPPKPPFPPQLHLTLLGHPSWDRDWGRYAALSAFDDWEPGEELGWLPLKPEEEKALRARRGWGPGPRWALLQGDEVLASGTDLPKPSFLADRLRAEGIPYLEQLDAFIRAHPDHLEARAARMGALRSRMPNERLEATLLEDARATLEPFHPGAGAVMPMVDDWKPRKELWEPAARRALPELEARLRRWPERKESWEAWLDWAEVSADPPSPARLMESLAIWKARRAGGAGPLPDGVLEVVSKHLMTEERWKDLADWCRAFWEGGVREELARLALPFPGDGREDRDRRERQADLYTRALLAPYRMALERLGRAGQLKAFLQDLRDTDPSLVRALTVSSTPPRRD
ncbi:MAG TPA: hypothetical protein VL181_10845 [Holophagaceae bacterium]|nr:hypothetical protein [Holophagaceae bacterium]